MKLNRLETHDRLLHLKEDQSANVFQGAEECLKKNPLSLAIQEKAPYVYIFAHPRTADNGVDKDLYWQPRLSIPKAQDNSYLFRAVSKSDIIEVCWMLPPRPLWKQYRKGNVTEDNWCRWSIQQFIEDKSVLERAHPQDLSEEVGKKIMQAIVNEHRQLQELKKIKKPKPNSSASLILPWN